MRKVNLAVIGFLIHGEIDDPAKGKLVAVNQIKLFANAIARATGEIGKSLWHTGAEKHGIAIFKAKLLFNLRGAFFADIFGQRPRSFAIAEEDIAKPRLPFALRPAVHAVTKGPTAAGFGRYRPDPHLVVFGNHIGKNLEIGTVKGRRDILHFNRDTQIRLV